MVESAEDSVRICVFSERQVRAADEGIRNYALALARALDAGNDVHLLTVFGESQTGGGRLPRRGVTDLPGNPLLLSLPLRRELRRLAPDLVIYVPTACATPFSWARSRVLKSYGLGAPVAQVDLQPRAYGRFARRAMRVLWRARCAPDVVLVQSETTRGTLRPFGCSPRLIRAGVDLERFRPVRASERAALRARHGVPLDAWVVLHVGHLNRGRGLLDLVALQGAAGQQLVIVGSSTTTQDAALVAELRARGVLVIDGYLSDVAEVYQLADCYVFPVRAARASIDVPLSVLEAMACDLPVVATRVEGLTRLFAPAPGLRYVDDPRELCEAVAACRCLPSAGTRLLVEPHAWPRVAEHVLQTIAEALSVESASRERR